MRKPDDNRRTAEVDKYFIGGRKRRLRSTMASLCEWIKNTSKKKR